MLIFLRANKDVFAWGPNTTRKRAIDDMATNGAPDMWCATTI